MSAAVPKAELHVHLEGTARPELIRRIAARNAMRLPPGLFADDDTFAWRDFLDFLRTYDLAASVIRTAQDYRDVVFEYLADVANHPEFMEHFTKDWHVTREDTYGKGAGVRFAFRQRRNKFPWIDQTIHDFEPPRRLVLVGRTGKFNRVRTLTTWELEPSSGGGTRVQVSFEKVPKMFSDRFGEGRGFHRAKWRKTVKVLRDVLEGERERGPRATIAGGARKPATGFRFGARVSGTTK